MNSNKTIVHLEDQFDKLFNLVSKSERRRNTRLKKKTSTIRQRLSLLRSILFDANHREQQTYWKLKYWSKGL